MHTDDSHPTASSPYGAWASPVSAELIAGATVRLGQVALQGSDVYWTEGRPQEGGRNVLVRCGADGIAHDVTLAPFDVRTRVHEYGGGAFALRDGGAVFCHNADQQLYRLDADRPTAVRLTAPSPRRYADATVDPRRDRLVAVCEDHGNGAGDAVASIVSVALDGSDGTAVRLVAGHHDFFSTPRFSPDGRQLAWLAWDHPNMPWDGSTLWLADVDAAGEVAEPRCVAGGADESIFQPAWSPDGALHFVSDRSGWWNLYRLGSDGAFVALQPMDAEFGEPQWAFGMSTYGFAGDGRIVCTYRRDGRSHLSILDPARGSFETLETPFCSISGLQVGDRFAVFIGATATEPGAVVRFDLQARDWTVLRRSGTATVDAGFVSVAEPIRFPTAGGLEAHAFFYAPTNRDAAGPRGQRPPLIVVGHGGPTGAADPGFKWSHQFWTSRGFAVVDVNYGGSSGFGRAYRDRLRGRWGEVDVDDSIAAAAYLVGRGDVDADRIAIRGASAGGYTALAALTFRRFFKAGASHYGIGDLEALVRDTHKFESRYLDRLVGPYPAARALYVERSPVHHVERLASPMILFQGAEDKAVPPAQAQAMFDAVSAKGLPVALLMFDGEQHGFRRAATIRRVLEAELFFYGRVFGFEPAGPIEAVDIRNL